MNEVHLLGDLNAVIQPGAAATPPGDRAPRLPPRALLLTPVSPTAPLVALNLSLGDQAQLDQRDCGCPYQRAGWTTHLRDIESFAKLNAGGMTFLDTGHPDPGGRPACALRRGADRYQLLEEEGPDGRPRVVLVVRPEVGPLDSAAVAAWFLERLGRGSGAERIMALTWQQSGILEVARRAPAVTAAGKILPVLRGARPKKRIGRGEPI